MANQYCEHCKTYRCTNIVIALVRANKHQFWPQRFCIGHNFIYPMHVHLVLSQFLFQVTLNVTQLFLQAMMDHTMFYKNPANTKLDDYMAALNRLKRNIGRAPVKQCLEFDATSEEATIEFKLVRFNFGLRCLSMYAYIAFIHTVSSL